MRDHNSNEKDQQRAEIAEMTEQYLAAGGTVEQFQYLCKSATFDADRKYNQFDLQSNRNKLRNGE